MSRTVESLDQMTVQVSGRINLTSWPNRAGGTANGYADFSQTFTFGKNKSFNDGILGTITISSWTSSSGVVGYEFVNAPYVVVYANGRYTSAQDCYGHNVTTCEIGYVVPSSQSPYGTAGIGNVSSQISYTTTTQTEYLVIFEDGFGGTLKTQWVTSGGNATAPSVSDREDYAFVGWDSSFTNVQSDITVTAQWTQKLTITFDANGGSFPQTSMKELPGNVTLPNTEPTRTNYRFGGWDIDGVKYQAGATYNLQVDVTAYASWVGSNSISTDYTTEEGVPEPQDLPEITISGGSGPTYDEGAEITVTAQASITGGVFSSWTVSSAVPIPDGHADGNVYTFTMPNGAVSLIANYAIAPVAVTHSIDSPSRIAVIEGADTVAENVEGKLLENAVYGDEFTFIAPTGVQIKEGFSFYGWKVNGTIQESEGALTLTLTGDTTVYAVYAGTLTVEKEENGGTGTFTIDYVSSGTSVKIVRRAYLGHLFLIEALPDADNYFGGWKKDGILDLSVSRGPNAVLINAAEFRYTAVFLPEPILLSVTATNEKSSEEDTGSLGTLTITGDGVTGSAPSYTVEAFSQITLTATKSSAPDAESFGGMFEVRDGVTRIVSRYSPVMTRTLVGVDTNFVATWGESTKFTVNVSSSDSSMGSVYIGDVRGVVSVTDVEYAKITVSAVPVNGYRFVEWRENGSAVSKMTQFTFFLYRSQSLVAVFEPDTAAILEWEGSDSFMAMRWRSKVYTFPRPFDPVAARVDATGYPLELTVGTMSSPNAEPTRLHPLVVQGQDGRRLQRMRPERFLQFTVEASAEVDAVVIGTNMAEVN